MDRALFIAMTGASQTRQALGVTTNNLANVSTAGFRAELAAAGSAPVAGAGWATRVNAVGSAGGFDARAGGVVNTGRALDIALRGDGWLAVQADDGTVGYTRAGNLQVNALGQLTTAAGHPVLGDGGPVAVPPHDDLAIGDDGTVSIVPTGAGPDTRAAVARLQVIEAGPETLMRGADGLFRLREGEAALPMAGDSVIPGALEQSNVNATEALVNMIEQSRKFEMQVRMMRTLENNAEAGARLLRQT